MAHPYSISKFESSHIRAIGTNSKPVRAAGHTSVTGWQARTSSVKTLTLRFNGLLNTPVFNQQPDDFFAVNRVTEF